MSTRFESRPADNPREQLHDRVHGQLAGLRQSIDVGQTVRQVGDMKESVVDAVVNNIPNLTGLTGLIAKARQFNVKVPQWLELAIAYCAKQPKAIAAAANNVLGMSIDVARETQNGVAANQLLEQIARDAQAKNPASADPVREAFTRIGQTGRRPANVTELAAAVAALSAVTPAPATAPTTTPPSAPASRAA